MNSSHQSDKPPRIAEAQDIQEATLRFLGQSVPGEAPTEPTVAQAGTLLETLLENSPDAIYFKDLRSRFVRCSKVFCKLYNLESVEGLKGKSDFDLFTEEHARPAFEDEQEIIRTGKPMVGKLEKETYQDGRVRWALTSKMPWRDRKGAIIGTFGISKDVTAIKQIEEELARERELLKTLLDNVPDCIWFKDRESRFVRVSRSKLIKSVQRVPRLREQVETGKEPDGQLLLGLTDFDLYTEEHARTAYEAEQEMMRTGKDLIDELEKQTHPDGTVTWSLCTKMLWRDHDGNIRGTFGTSRDITPLKEAEAELANTHTRLVEASRLAGMAEVASDVLHNVGNTLNSINVSCGLAIDRVKELNFSKLAKIPELLRQNVGRLDEFLTTDPQGKHLPDYIAAVAENGDGQRTFLLEELILLRQHVEHVNRILTMQQSYAKVAGVAEQVDLKQLIEDALHINQAALERHEVPLRRHLLPVPPMLLDKHKVLQILVNLIRNAKYALDESGRPDKLMTVTLTPKGPDQVEIQVIDNGVGIPPENLTRIFSHGFTTRRNGHGFGLHSGALAARELGGELTAQSDGPGNGAVFTLRLPVKQSA